MKKLPQAEVTRRNGRASANKLPGGHYSAGFFILGTVLTKYILKYIFIKG